MREVAGEALEAYLRAGMRKTDSVLYYPLIVLLVVVLIATLVVLDADNLQIWNLWCGASWKDLGG